MTRSTSVLLVAATALLVSCMDVGAPLTVSGSTASLAKKSDGSLRARGATNRTGDFRAHFSARSGANGENPRGHWFFTRGPKGNEITQYADVVCLAIVDHRAVIGLRFTKKTTDASHPAGTTALVVVEDNGKVVHRTSPDLWAFATDGGNPTSEAKRPSRKGKAADLCANPPEVTLASWLGNIKVAATVKGPDDDTDGELLVTPSDATLRAGDNLQLSAVFTNADDGGSGQVAWTSSDASVATVNSTGVVTGVAPGTASITARSGQHSDAATITVVNPSPPVGLVITLGDVGLAIALGTITVGTPVQRVVTVLNAGLTPATVEPPSSNGSQCVVEAVNPLSYPTLMQAGSSVTFNVNITAAAPGAGSCIVTVTSSIPTSDAITFSYNAAAPTAPPGVTVLTASIINTGSSPVAVNEISSDNAAFTFAVTGGAPPRTIAAGASLAVVVTYTATPGSTPTGNLTVVTNGIPASFQIPVTYVAGSPGGSATFYVAPAPPDPSGQPAVLELSVSPGEFAALSAPVGNITVGQAVRASVTVMNNTSTPYTLMMPSSNDSQCVIQAVSPLTYPVITPAGGMATFNVNIAPAAVGADTCIITVTTNRPTFDTIIISFDGVASVLHPVADPRVNR